MPSLSLLFAALTVAAALSLAVERVLEVIKHLRDSENTKGEGAQVTRAGMASIDRARTLIADIRSVLDAYQQAKTLDTSRVAALREKRTPDAPIAPAVVVARDESGDEGAGFERHDSVTVVRASLPSVGEAQTALVLSLFATGIGIVLAELFKLTLVSLFLGREVPHWIDITLTGIVIGGGSQPIHVLLRFLTSRKVDASPAPAASSEDGARITPPGASVAGPAAAVTARVEAPVAPAPGLEAAEDSHWLPIAYSGGVKPESLELTHLRSKEPDLIVYHHTAMSSSIPFQGVVDEFLVNKGWQTGYHCVVMPDGAIKPFCRWDRTGNHAKGLNHRSLGLAFHGNFHTLANDRYSNVDGRFGIQRPSPAQLDAGARVVALWVHLYPTIQLDFVSDILPHKTAMPGHTVCPGSNFPHDEFQQKVRACYERWARSPVAQQQIALFKQNRYIYATAGGRS